MKGKGESLLLHWDKIYDIRCQLRRSSNIFCGKSNHVCEIEIHYWRVWGVLWQNYRNPGWKSGGLPTQYILKLKVKPAVERIRVGSSAFFSTVWNSVVAAVNTLKWGHNELWGHLDKIGFLSAPHRCGWRRWWWLSKAFCIAGSTDWPVKIW